MALAACKDPASYREGLSPSPDQQAVTAASRLGVARSPDFQAARATLAATVAGWESPQVVATPQASSSKPILSPELQAQLSKATIEVRAAELLARIQGQSTKP
jgi:hypothetical protein